MSTPAENTHWRQETERSNAGLMRLMVWLSLRLGRPASRLILHGIAAYFLLFARRARQASAAYLARVHGRPASMAEQYRHFLAFASCVHDRIYLLNGRFDLFDIRVIGAEVIQQHADAGRGILLMGAHLGSFEAMRAMGRQHTDLKVCMAMYAEHAAKLMRVLAAINPDAVQDIVPLGQMNAMLDIRDRLDAGQMVGLLCDRSGNENAAARIEDSDTHCFLGAPARFPLGPFRMAAMLRRPVVFMSGLYLGGNRYELHFENLADFSALERADRQTAMRVAQARYVERLEHYCRMAPSNWFNFFDFWRSEPSTPPASPTRA